MNGSTHRLSNGRLPTFSFALVAFILITGALHANAQAAPKQVGDDASLFGKLILQRVEAFVRGDVDAYKRLIADDFVHVDDAGIRRSGAQVLARVAANKGDRARPEIGAVFARRFGNIEIVDCELTMRAPFGQRDLPLPGHETNIFVLREGRWLLLQHAETPVLVQPKAVSVDEQSLNAYVGRYEWWPGYAEIVTRRGNQLFVQATGDETPTAVLFATGESFFAEGDPSLGVFVRNEKGKVTGEVVHFLNGQVVEARKTE